VSSESETLIAERLEGSPAHLGPDPGELEPKSAAEAGKRIAELEAENARLRDMLTRAEVIVGSAHEVICATLTKAAYSILDYPEEESHTYPDGSKITIKANPVK